MQACSAAVGIEARGLRGVQCMMRSSTCGESARGGGESAETDLGMGAGAKEGCREVDEKELVELLLAIRLRAALGPSRREEHRTLSVRRRLAKSLPAE